ncbi:Natterin-4 [Holothuria leucospilota]|uniref:Natterin-4 n=1 Tax=Holothuria leucospilota TaxID=206669 RepID=A0A9Q1HE11_HOLLE|nr:Natterin-4 [Holothuria leucospilota]
MVKDLSGDALKPPTGFTQVWNDAGSGGSQDVRIMSMTPPSGYVCLGHVAVIGYSNVPDKNLYRCVKKEYVTKGTYEFIWNDAGSGASHDVSLWSNRVSESNTYGLDANTFTSFSSHSSPTGSPDLLDARKVVNDIDYIVDDTLFSLTVYEIPDVEKIYYDAGTGASRDISVWRSKGPADTFSLGDLAVPTHTKPEVGFVVKPHNETTFTVPYDFEQIWNDAGSGGDWDGAFWKPLCNPGYRAIGHVAIRSETTKPDKGSVRCINETFTVPGKWEFIWDDANSGSHQDVSVYRAAAKDEGGQALGAMTSFKGYGDPDTTPYVLDASETNYIQGPPAIKYVLQNLHYHLDDYNLIDNQPSSIARTTVENTGAYPATSTRTLQYTYEENYSWSNTAGGEIGVEMKVTAGIPFISKGEIGTSAVGTYEHEWAGYETTTFSDSVDVGITVQPCCTKAAEVSGWRYKMDVPYDATLVTYYADGTQGVREDYQGVFRGVEVSEIHIVYEPDIPIPGCNPETKQGRRQRGKGRRRDRGPRRGQRGKGCRRGYGPRRGRRPRY